MEFNRTKNSTRTFIFGVFSRVISILGPFVTRTIIIHKLGNEYLGLSSLFTSVLSILNISELGIGSAITFCLYKPVAEDDRESVKALLALLKKLYRFIGGSILLIGLALMPFLPKLIKGETPPDVNIYILYAMYLFNAAASYLGFAYKGVLFNVYQRGDVTHKIEATVEIIKYFLQVIVLLLFSNYYWFAAVLPLSTALITVANEIVSKKMFPDLVPKGNVSEEVKGIIKNKVLILSAHSIASTLTNSVDNIVISGGIGLTAIALYGNYHYISSSVLAFILIAYRALTPAIGNSLVSNSKENNIELFNSLFYMFFWIISFCCTSLLCLYQPFMTLWVGKENLLSITVVIMVTAYFYSNATRQLMGTYVGAAGLWEKTLFRQIVAAISNLILDLLLVKQYGIAGIVFASFFTNFAIALPLDIYVTYRFILKMPFKKGLYKTIGSFLGTTLLCFVTYEVCMQVCLSGVVGLLIRLLICIVLPNAILLLLTKNTKEFRYTKDHILTLLYVKRGRKTNEQ